MIGIDAPAGFWESEDPKEQDRKIKENMRGIVQLFDIRVLVYPDRVEIKGVIPTQVLSKTACEELEDAPIIPFLY
jgi:hypothetical protein